MKHLFRIVLATIITFSFATLSHAQTVILAPISTNTTWAAANGPFLVGIPVTIQSGATLTIEPGTVVKFTDQSAGIEVQAGATLSAQGTAVSPIYFTSFSDDIGGDTNGDGSATVPENRQWGRIINFGSLNLAHTTLRYGGYIAGGLSLRPGSMTTLTNATVHDMGSDGISQLGGTLTATSSTISSNGKGLDQSGGTATFSSSTFLNNTQGFEVQGTSTALSLTNNTFTDNGALGALPSFGTFTHTGNTASGGALDGFQISGAVTSSRTLTESDVPYIVNGVLTVHSGAELTLEAGATLKFRDTTSGLEILAGGTLTGTGTTAKPITFTAFTGTTDRLWGRIINRGILNLTHATISNGGYVAGGLTTTVGSLTTLDHVTLSQMGSDGISNGGISTITYTSITGNSKGIDMVGGTLSINQSAIHNNSTGIDNGTGTLVDATNNWWGDVTGPLHATNPNGEGDTISGNVDFTPWLESDPTITCVQGAVGCASNIIFFPGIMGSHLYDESNPIDSSVWPTSIEVKQARLAMNSLGESIYPIFTANDTRREFGEFEEDGIIEGILSANIYKSFILDLRDWKNEGLYRDYAFIPYDWRQSLDQIVEAGKVSTNGERLTYDGPKDFTSSFIYQKFAQLAATSKTGKVSIVAHSNGGLVTKAFIEKLRTTNDPLYNKIDKIVFVAVPQAGTPDALISLLHGTNIGPVGAYVDKQMTRTLAKNMPMMYNLLPSEAYFTKVAQSYPQDATVVTFPGDILHQTQFLHYGGFINTADEMHDYILNSETDTTRDSALPSDVQTPLVGNQLLLANANTVHTALDSWTPPPGAKLTQVAGWGMYTNASIYYDTVKKMRVDSIFGTPELYDARIIRRKTIVNGDGTVVDASARLLNVSGNVEDWFVNLDEYKLGNVNRIHRDILEVPDLRLLVNNTISNLPFDATPIITTQAPNPTTVGSRINYQLHSPLTLGVTDSQGRYTGLDPLTNEVKEDIPDVSYEQIGETQFLSVPTDIAHTLTMKGYENGSFALDIEKQEGNTVTESTSYQAVPSTVDTVVTMPVTANQSVETTALILDEDGDGTPEETVQADPEGVLIYGFKKLTLTPDNKTISLGAPLPELSYILSGFTEGDTVENSTAGLATCTTTATTASPIGTYPITCATGGFTSSTYVIYEFVAGALTILPPLTVSANPTTIALGEEIPTLTATISGFINEDTAESATTGVPDCTTTATIDSPAGNYPITCAIGTLDAPSYLVTTYIDSILTVLPTLTVTADDKVIIEGNTIPSLTSSVTGFLNGDTQALSTSGSPECTTTATATSAPGAYPIICTRGTLTSSTYAFTSFISGTLTIEPAIVIHPLTLTAGNKSITQGLAIPALTYTLNGFLNSDTQSSATTGQPLCTTTATSTSPVGTYPITCTEGTFASATYTIDTYTDGVLTITDGTPPELQTVFDLALKDVALTAIDTVDEQPALTHTGNTITMSDSAGNATSINLTKYKESSTKLKLTYNSITRNGVTTSVPNTTIEYNWSLTNTNTLKDLDTKVKIQGEEKYTFAYNKGKHETKIKVKTGNSHTTTTRDGFVAVTVTTELGGIRVQY